MITATDLRRIAALGFTPEQLTFIADCLGGVTAAYPRNVTRDAATVTRDARDGAKERNALRQREYRARKKSVNKSAASGEPETVTRDDTVTCHDVTRDAVAVTEPVTEGVMKGGKGDNLTSLSSLPSPEVGKKEEAVVVAREPRGVKALKDVATLKMLNVHRWEEFQANYPRRAGEQGWTAARKKYAAYVADGVTERDMIDGAKRYADNAKAVGNDRTPFVKQAVTWLNQRGWEDEYVAAKPQQSDIMGAIDRIRAENSSGQMGHGSRGSGGVRPSNGAASGHGLRDDHRGDQFATGPVIDHD